MVMTAEQMIEYDRKAKNKASKDKKRLKRFDQFEKMTEKFTIEQMMQMGIPVTFFLRETDLEGEEERNDGTSIEEEEAFSVGHHVWGLEKKHVMGLVVTLTEFVIYYRFKTWVATQYINPLPDGRSGKDFNGYYYYQTLVDKHKLVKKLNKRVSRWNKKVIRNGQIQNKITVAREELSTIGCDDVVDLIFETLGWNGTDKQMQWITTEDRAIEADLAVFGNRYGTPMQE